MSARHSQRAILVTLSGSGPMTVKLLAAKSGVKERNAANLCSMMSGNGLLTEHPSEDGGQKPRRYGAASDVLPSDARVIRELTDAYGPKIVRRLVRESEEM